MRVKRGRREGTRPWIVLMLKSRRASGHPKAGGIEQMNAGGSRIEAHRIADVRLKSAGQLNNDTLFSVAPDVHHCQAAEIFNDAHRS